MTAKSDRWDILWLWIFPVAVLIAGVAILISGTGRSEREAVIDADPVESTAVVVSIDAYESGRNRLTGQPTLTYQPTVALDLHNGTEVTTELDGVFDQSEYRVGELVAVTYSAADPTAIVATEDRFGFRPTIVWGRILILGSSVLIVALIAGTIWFRRITRPKPRRS